MKQFKIGDRKIGSGAPCFIIAEAGVNHDGSLDQALALVDAAAKAGADAVKFQTWITEKVCKPGARKADYQQTQCPDAADQFAMLKRLELPYAWHGELKKRAGEKGIIFLSTPDEIQSARFLCELGVPVIKIGSGELTNLPFLRQLAALRRPLILSTGMGNLDDVQLALTAIQSVAQVPLALLHCVSAYPAPDDEMNLRCITTLRRTFEMPVGLSDHTTGHLAAALAAGLGMDILEKHLTLNRKLSGPDHAASADPGEFAELVQVVRKAEKMLGTGVKALAASEISTRQAVQRTLLYARDLPAGHVLAAGDMESLRCGVQGLPPDAATRIIGRTLQKAIQSGAAVVESDLQ
jgi:N-acetylneuraminate synthase/N,N'-diacetyllegionaminate synthase